MGVLHTNKKHRIHRIVRQCPEARSTPIWPGCRTRGRGTAPSGHPLGSPWCHRIRAAEHDRPPSRQWECGCQWTADELGCSVIR